MSTSVIISTYNSPAWLRKVVWGYQAQTRTDFELIVADDGSRDDTRLAVEELSAHSPFPIRHVWQEDKGFRKCEILNKAIAASEGDYLIISDGDCVPRADFVQVHMDLRQEDHFVSGGYCKLPMLTSETITREDIVNQNAFDPAWLRANGCPNVPLKLRARGAFAKLLNYITPTSPTWNGHNASGWKKNILAVNGFNEDMEYGGEDREMGERLINNGIAPIQARHLAICIHLDHARAYIRGEALEKNAEIRELTRRSGIAWAERGIVKGPRPTTA